MYELLVVAVRIIALQSTEVQISGRRGKFSFKQEVIRYKLLNVYREKWSPYIE